MCFAQVKLPCRLWMMGSTERERACLSAESREMVSYVHLFQGGGSRWVSGRQTYISACHCHLTEAEEHTWTVHVKTKTWSSGLEGTAPRWPRVLFWRFFSKSSQRSLLQHTSLQIWAPSTPHCVFFICFLLTLTLVVVAKWLAYKLWGSHTWVIWVQISFLVTKYTLAYS